MYRHLTSPQAETDVAIPGHEAQRREPPGARRIVLEEERVDGEPREDALGDGVVTALANPLALVVAAAEVDANGHAARPVPERIVDETHVAAHHRIGVVAAAAESLPELRVAEQREGDVIQLDVRRPADRKIDELLVVDPPH